MNNKFLKLTIYEYRFSPPQIQYVPVLICTLNRYEHLKKTINALRDNPEAKYTDLFISVDYTQEDKYIDGYTKVKEYLKKGIEGFKTCTIYYQNNNLGPMDHFPYARELIKKHYNFNCIICLEDDLVVSNNYLSFMNTCFDYYKDEPSVLGISDTLSDTIEFDTKSISEKGYSTFLFWLGAERGIYLDKVDYYSGNVDYNLQRWLSNSKIVKELLKAYKDGFCMLIILALRLENKFLFKDGSTAPIDYYKTIYKFINNKYSVMPTMSKIKHIGLDGSGVHCDIVESGDVSVLDDSKSFTLIPCDERNPRSLSEQVRNLNYFSKKEYIKYLLLYYIYKLLGVKISKKIYLLWDLIRNNTKG